MTFYRAQGTIMVPGGNWFSDMLAARRELDALPEDDRYESTRGAQLSDKLERMTGVSLHDLNGDAIAELGLSFIYFDEAMRRLVLAVVINDKTHDGTYATDFDRLFDYDPEALQLTDQDTPYVVVKIDEHEQPRNPVIIIQPFAEDTPDGVCAHTPVPHEFIEQLLELAA